MACGKGISQTMTSGYCGYSCEDKDFQGQEHSVSQSTVCKQGHAATLKGNKDHPLSIGDAAVMSLNI